jgi:predicted CopG family antitoxin
MIRIEHVGGVVHKKLTITVDEQVYEGLHRVIGRQKISQFIETLVRPHVVPQDLSAAYREMAADEGREREAHEWAEATLRDVADETR